MAHGVILGQKTSTDDLLPRDGTRAMEADLNVGNHKVTNVANATAGTDAVNLNQLNSSLVATNILYNNSSTSSIITSNNTQGAIDQLFQSVSNGKSQIASAITDQGISTSSTASFATMATNIRNLNTKSNLWESAVIKTNYGDNPMSLTEIRTLNINNFPCSLSEVQLLCIKYNDNTKISMDYGQINNTILVLYYDNTFDNFNHPYMMAYSQDFGGIRIVNAPNYVKYGPLPTYEIESNLSNNTLSLFMPQYGNYEEFYKWFPSGLINNGISESIAYTVTVIY